MIRINHEQAACCVFVFRPGGRAAGDGLELVAKKLELVIDPEQATFALHVEARSLQVAQALEKRKPDFGAPSAEERMVIGQHLAAALNAERHPDIVCTGELRGRTQVQGELVICGKKRPVVCELAPAGENRQVAEVNVHLPDFDIATAASPLAALIDPEIVIRVLVVLKLG